MILVVAEQRSGALNRASWEAVACAQQLAGGDGLPFADVDADERAGLERRHLHICEQRDQAVRDLHLRPGGRRSRG